MKPCCMSVVPVVVDAVLVRAVGSIVSGVVAPVAGHPCMGDAVGARDSVRCAVQMSWHCFRVRWRTLLVAVGESLFR
jgi:hypothetical protein